VAQSWRDAGDQVYAATRGARADALAQAGLSPLTIDVTRLPTSFALPAVDTVVFAVGETRGPSTNWVCGWSTRRTAKGLPGGERGLS
jgi:hypothetical protein